MFKSIWDSLCKRDRWASKPGRRQSHFVHPYLLYLQDRVVPTAPASMTQLAQMFPTHSGPTSLWLNFDGGNVGGYSVAPFQSMPGHNRDQDIQDILYRASEIYAPFNVEVVRVNGAGSYSAFNGDSTIFIGGIASDVSSGVKYTAGFTPFAYTDFPGSVKGTSHQPNSDTYDLAFVDPVGASNQTVWDDQTIAHAVAHEAGHTFGLAHVLSQGFQDIMSYDSPNRYFVNSTFSITDLNYNPSTGLTLPDSNLLPNWQGTSIYEQDSYTYLQTVLGTGLNRAVADPGDVDPTYTSMGVPALHPGSTYSGTLFRSGDSNLFTLSSPTSQTLTITVQAAAGSVLNSYGPVVMVYDASGTYLLAEAHATQLQFNVTAGTTYKLVVAGEDGGATGSYHMAIGPLSQPGWIGLGGYDVRQIAKGRNQDGRLQVFALGGDHAVYVDTQTAPNANTWTGFSQNLGGWVSSIAVGEDAYDRTEVFAIGANTGLWVNTQTVANSSAWSGWTSLGGSGLKQIVTAFNGRLYVFGVGGDNGVYVQVQSAPALWSGWQPVGGWVSSIAVGLDANSHLEVFGIGANTGLWVTSQTGAGATSFGVWTYQGGSALQQITVGQNADGRLEVFAIGGDNALWHEWQTLAGTWSGWYSLGGYWASVTVGRESDGRLEAYTTDYSGHVSRIGQTVANGGWGTWTFLAGYSDQLVVGTNANGSLDLFSLSWDSGVYYLPNA